MNDKFRSRKFIISLFVVIWAPILPVAYKYNGISDSVTLMILGMISAVAAAYGVINTMDSKVEALKTKPTSEEASR